MDTAQRLSILKSESSTAFGNIEDGVDFKQEFQWYLGAEDTLQNKCEIKKRQ